MWAAPVNRDRLDMWFGIIVGGVCYRDFGVLDYWNSFVEDGEEEF